MREKKKKIPAISPPRIQTEKLIEQIYNRDGHKGKNSQEPKNNPGQHGKKIKTNFEKNFPPFGTRKVITVVKKTIKTEFKGGKLTLTES